MAMPKTRSGKRKREPPSEPAPRRAKVARTSTKTSVSAVSSRKPRTSRKPAAPRASRAKAAAEPPAESEEPLNSHFSRLDLEDASAESPSIPTAKAKHKKKESERASQLATHLPPLHDLDEIFKSITSKALEIGFDDCLSHLGGRPLRVVTMCSGTESPLLALEMVQESLRKNFGEVTFEFRHLFSAEIVPFKQAYIERNFQPRFLFRDVTELKNRVAQTAYGSLEKVPKNVDLLVAGFSCVDFSKLNSKRKSLDEIGESSGTFYSIIQYSKTYRPRIVVLENIISAPWDIIQEAWHGINYYTLHVEVDTKHYYLPQTRSRGYLLCVDRTSMAESDLSDERLDTWSDVLRQFRRPASSPVGMFLMNDSDIRIEQSEKEVAWNCSPFVFREWERYKMRHHSYRSINNLGQRRPVSKSSDNGTCQMPDFAWQAWTKTLAERVWDTIDMNFLRKLRKDRYDMNYKERYLELSQGIDRDFDSRSSGVVGCITPSGIPYITTRGRPFCGFESLALQGMPLDRLSLSRETKAQLQDLAGNAMSSTVVCAAMLSALIVAYPALKKGHASPSYGDKTHNHKALAPRNDDHLIPSVEPVNQAAHLSLLSLQTQSVASVRYCVCESQTGTRSTILRCTLCEHTACSDCAGNPTHAYERWSGLDRSQPLDFISQLKSILPMRLALWGMTSAKFDPFIPSDLSDDERTFWSSFLDAVQRASGDELRFEDIRRTEVWTASYRGKSAFLDLVIDATSIQWLYFAKPLDNEPVASEIREVLSQPIARMTPKIGSILEGEWEISVPLGSKTSLDFCGCGEKVPSLEAWCGLQDPEYENSTAWSYIQVQGTDQAVQYLDVDIRGTYQLLKDCGTAMSSLHKKPATADTPAVYLFLDPAKYGEAKDDSFVFSLEHRRISGYGKRNTIAEISATWRSWEATENPQSVDVYYNQWTKAPIATLSPFAPNAPISCYNLEPGHNLSIGFSECHDSNTTLFSFSAPAATVDSFWRKGPWKTINPQKSSPLLKDLSWLLQRAAGFFGFENWNSVLLSENPRIENGTACSVCVPPKPKIIWGRDRRNWMKAYEDPHDAAVYERGMKARPSPFLIFHRVDEHDVGKLSITLNVQTLLHQAYNKLIGLRVAQDASFSWRLVPNCHDMRNFNFPKFELISNRDDAQAGQPPNFLLDLRPEQLRSLSWMIQQEKQDPVPFVEEETEEALLPLLMWRAEGKVAIPKVVRGGVLADDVGYGKTAITLGLIDTRFEQGPAFVPRVEEGLIAIKATLIVTPRLLLEQWQSEIEKFLGGKYKVMVLRNATALKQSIFTFKKADIILVPWALLDSTVYYTKMQQFTGMPEVPEKRGRHFDKWFTDAEVSLREHVQILANSGSQALLQSIEAKRQQVKDRQAESTYAPSQRLRGQKYADARQKEAPDAEDQASSVELSSDDESCTSDFEDENRLRAKVDRLLKLLPPPPPLSEEPENQPQDDEDATSISEDEAEAPPPSKKSAKRNSSRAKKAQQKAIPWDDRKEFNIGKNTNWAHATIPLLHIFLFNRVVIDEFTYADTDKLVALQALQARSKWVLSGTPPLNNFADLNTIAPFLDIHLGIDDDDDRMENPRLKKMRSQRTDAEVFQSFRVPRSDAWHANRHAVGQRFLGQFTRRNIAEIEEIPFTEHIVLVSLSPAERVIYLELYKQIMAPGLRRLRRRSKKKTGNDEFDRVDEIVGSSNSVTEALLKRCASLCLEGQSGDNQIPEPTTLASLVTTREKQLATLKEEFVSKLAPAVLKERSGDTDREYFDKLKASVERHEFGDMTVTSEAYPMIEEAMKSPRPVAKPRTCPPKICPLKSKSKRKEPSPEEEEEEECNVDESSEPIDLEFSFRDIVTNIRNILVEWVLRQRALRFLKAVRMVQSTPARDTPMRCHCCSAQSDSLEDISILGSCGHALCPKCILKCKQSEECAIKWCRGSVQKHNLIRASSLGGINQDHDENDDQGTEFGGRKMDKLVEILRAIPTGEVALLFIQFDQLMQAATEVLDRAGIAYTALFATEARQSPKRLLEFLTKGFKDSKVLILKLGSEMACGLNLQVANHVIFLSPMLAETQYDYDSAMTQAVGRSRRYGQSKHVHIYHILAKMTVDVNIFQDRREKVLVERDGEATLVAREDAVETELMGCEAPSLVADYAI